MPVRRRALVTGAARGIGRACVRALSAAGHECVAVWHQTRPPGPDEPTGPGRIVDWRCDLADEPQRNQLIPEATQALGGPIDILVANAAMVDDRLAHRMTDDQFARVLTVNLIATAHLVTRAADAMAEHAFGRIVIISSAGAILGSDGQANYAAAKAALHGLARELAPRLAPSGVTINVVAPGVIDTEWLAGLTPRRRSTLTRMTPAGRPGQPSEVASLVAFLASDEAGYVTGTVVPVDGALSATGRSGGTLRQEMARARSAGGPPDGPA